MESEDEKKYTQKDLDEIRKRAERFEDESLKLFRISMLQKAAIVLLVLLVGILLLCWGVMDEPKHNWLAYLGLAVLVGLGIWGWRSK